MAEHRPHVLAEFSLVSGFLGYILCSIAWMVCIFHVLSFFNFSYFINSSTKPIINLESKEIIYII
jgi:hypothetical protein